VVEQTVIGIDGGGTRTRVVLANTQGVVLGVGEGGSGNYHDVGADQVCANVELALEQAWEAAGLCRTEADAAFFGLGSIAAAADREVIRKLARQIGIAPDQCVGVDHDLRIALAGGLVGQPGIVLIAGTGSSCYGRAEDGRTWRAGGWGPMLDDVGSGGWLGLQSMIAAVREADGRGDPTVLTARVLDALQINEVDEILKRVDAQGLARREKAALGRLVTQAASEGDVVAQQIIARGAAELAELIATVAQQLDLIESLGTVPVAVTGGLTSAGDVFMDPLREAVQRRAPQCEVIEPSLPPVLGAVLLAIELLGIPVDAHQVAQLKQGQAVCN